MTGNDAGRKLPGVIIIPESFPEINFRAILCCPYGTLMPDVKNFSRGSRGQAPLRIPHLFKLSKHSN